MVCDFLNMRRCMNVINFQIKIKFLTPNCRLKVKQTRSMQRDCHIWNHWDEIVGIRSRFAETVVVIVVAQHADSFAPAGHKEKHEISRSKRFPKYSLISVRISHVPIGTINWNTAMTSPKICADVITVATNSRRFLAFIHILKHENI